MRIIRPTQTSKRASRKASVTVEMSMVLPVLFLFFFSQVELVRLNNIRNSVYLAAYQGARAGLVPGATTDEIRASVNEILSAVGAINAHTSTSPQTILATTEEITVTVTVPLDSNGWIIPNISRGKSLTASVTLKREIDESVFVIDPVTQ